MTPVLLAVAAIGALIAIMMARTNVDDPSEFTQAIRSQDARTFSKLPIVGLTFATRLTNLHVVQDDALGTNTVELAGNQSLTARGVLAQDQTWLKDDSLTLDESSKLLIVWDGPARCLGIAPIAKNDRLVCGPNGMMRTYDPIGAGDTEDMVKAVATCGITVTGDVVDIIAMFQHGGA